MSSNKGFFRRLYKVLTVATAILISAAVISASLMFFRQQAEREIRAAHMKAVNVLRTYIDKDDGEETVAEELEDGSRWTDAKIIIFDSKGAVRISTESASFADKCLSQHTMDMADPELVTFSSLDGFFDTARLCVVSKINVDRGDMYVVSSMAAVSYTRYLAFMVVVACVCIALLIVVEFPIINYHVERYTKPIESMTLAAQRFGSGDFSAKVEVTDHNEMGLLANTLNEMAESLEQIEDSRKSFVSNVSHELKTPMTTISGFVDGILDGTIPESERRRYLTTVSEETHRLARLVRSMLNISKYESGEVEISKKQFDLTSLTVKTVLLFEHRIDEKKVDIQGLDSDPHVVCADPDLIQQVIYNLTENAVKFVNNGGYIRYSFFENGGKTGLSIKNSGEGLKKAEMKRVFDRFYKTDESRGKDITGVGLGLSIVRSIINLHNGEILVRSKEKEYTEFEFILSQQ
ncbi:MAG: HAMP domain-containing histidine kinase [Oscillospiraceae bacterium]|nr:HAMP domain-containing histidine kinase [Oscillospiraceae bacterium]